MILASFTATAGVSMVSAERKAAAKIKAYSYQRWSTDKQEAGDSKRRQTSLAEAYVARHEGLELVDTGTAYHDEGVSAYRGANITGEGKLASFLNAVRAGDVPKGSYLLVEALDRLSRDKARRAMRTLEDIVDAGVVVVTLADGKTYTAETLNDDPTALMYVLVVAMRAHDESANKARRLREAWKGKLLAGKPLTAICPAWLTLKPDRSGFDVSKERAAIVRRIFRMTLEGTGQQAIAFTLNAEGVAPWGLGKRKPGKMWSKSYIAKVLSNPAVVGTFVPHTENYGEGKRRLKREPQAPMPGYFPAVIDAETWQRVQDIRAKRAPSTKPGQQVRNIFGGLLKCPLCASSMQMVQKGPNGGAPRLVCSEARTGGGCEYVSVPYPQVESAFLRHSSRVLAEAPHAIHGQDLIETASEIEGEIADATRTIDTLIDELARAPSPAIRERLQEYEAYRVEQKAKLAQVEQMIASADKPLIARKLADLRAALKPLDRARANVLLRQLAKAVVVDYQQATLRIEWTHGGESDLLYSFPDTPGAGRRSSRPGQRKRDRAGA